MLLLLEKCVTQIGCVMKLWYNGSDIISVSTRRMAHNYNINWYQLGFLTDVSDKITKEVESCFSSMFVVRPQQHAKPVAAGMQEPCR